LYFNCNGIPYLYLLIPFVISCITYNRISYFILIFLVVIVLILYPNSLNCNCNLYLPWQVLYPRLVWIWWMLNKYNTIQYHTIPYMLSIRVLVLLVILVGKVTVLKRLCEARRDCNWLYLLLSTRWLILQSPHKII